MFNFLVYLKFRSWKWNKLSPSKRLEYFQKMENIMAKKAERECYSIQTREWNDGTRGLCVYNIKTIFIDETFIYKNNYQFLGLATLFHEERHAEQYYLVKRKKNIGRFSKEYKWKQNMLSYTQYDEQEKYSYYSMQEIERDANRFALNRLKRLYFWLKKDRYYLLSLEQKEEEFEFVKKQARKELGLFYKLKIKAKHRKRKK